MAREQDPPMNEEQRQALYDEAYKEGDDPEVQSVVSQLRAHGFNKAAAKMVEMHKQIAELQRINKGRGPDRGGSPEA